MDNKLSDAQIVELQKLITPWIEAKVRLDSNLTLVRQAVVSIMDAYAKCAGCAVVLSTDQDGIITQTAE